MGSQAYVKLSGAAEYPTQVSFGATANVTQVRRTHLDGPPAGASDSRIRPSDAGIRPPVAC